MIGKNGACDFQRPHIGQGRQAQADKGQRVVGGVLDRCVLGHSIETSYKGKMMLSSMVRTSCLHTHSKVWGSGVSKSPEIPLFSVTGQGNTGEFPGEYKNGNSRSGGNSGLS